MQQFCEEERDEVLEFCDNALCFFDDMCEGELEEFTLTMKRDGSGHVEFLVVQENGKCVTDGFEFYEHDSGVDAIPECMSAEEEGEDDVDVPDCDCDACRQIREGRYNGLRESTVSAFEEGLMKNLRMIFGEDISVGFPPK